MTVKSVIDIDLKDEKFRRFVELFNKHQANLAKMPEAWGKVAGKQSELAKGFQAMTGSLLAQLELTRETADEEDKRSKRLSAQAKYWQSISKASASTAKNLLNIGASIIKWGGFIGGLAAGGSLFGLDRMASAVSDQRKASSGLGLSIGEMKAFGNAFSRFLDPGSILSSANESITDVSKQGSLLSIGVNPNQSTSAVVIDELKRVRQLALATPLNQLGILNSSRLSGLGFSVEDLRRLKEHPGEFGGQLATYRSNQSALNINDETAQKWQHFTQKLDEAGDKIFKVFVDVLAPLEPNLTHLSEAVVNLFQRVGANSNVGKDIDMFADWIGKLSGKISKPEFLTSFDVFITKMTDFAETAGNIVGFLAHPLDNIGRTWSDAIGDASHQDFLNNVIKGQAAAFGVPWEVLAAQWNQESSGATGGVIRSKKGAMGVMGLMPGTAKDMGVNNPDDPVQNVAGGAKYLGQLLRKYHGDVSEALAAYNWGPGNLDSDMAKYGQDWMKHLPTETSNYIRDVTKNAQMPGVLKAEIKISNATGNDVVGTTNQLNQ